MSGNKILNHLFAKWEQLAGEARRRGKSGEDDFPPGYWYGVAQGYEMAAADLRGASDTDGGQPEAPTEPREIVIANGRACLHMVAATHVLLEREPFWTEALLLRLVRWLYTRRLQNLIALLPEDMVVEILAEHNEPEILGDVTPFSAN